MKRTLVDKFRGVILIGPLKLKFHTQLGWLRVMHRRLARITVTHESN